MVTTHKKAVAELGNSDKAGEEATEAKATYEPALTEDAIDAKATTESTSEHTERGAIGSENVINSKQAEVSVKKTWPAIPQTHPLAKFMEKLDGILEEANYDEVYSIHLKGATEAQRKLILQKFLRANANDIAKACSQLLDTLRWRKAFQPLRAKDEIFERRRFEGLGYVTSVETVPTTWNIYGSVKDAATTFGDLDGFMRWRVGMMEATLSHLDMAEAATPIPDYGEGPDPYQCYQVHDYLSVSFLRQDPHTKSAAKKAVEIFQRHYPETLSRKFFVNVPIVMGWMFSAMRLVLSKETVRKFTVITYGKDLAGELGNDIPRSYGGSNPDLSVEGEQLAFADPIAGN